jgi:hypothetical protein
MCGSVRYEISEPPLFIGYCHCTRCQRRTGTAASVSLRIVPTALKILAGEALVRSFSFDDGWSKEFCGRCGSALWSHARDGSGAMSVRLGTLDQDPGLRPSYRQFVGYASPWEPIPDDGLPRYPEARPPQGP